ncbi:MAG: hypothetical protein A2898_05580 [Candidatus Kerfeldbacteria bacterium RIFCSPLOWO2_01_FULL_48_11]|uniref:HD domain-containing protein n=1 Tax=Candidatus Kerfeldbacteria bacterium RIFCSPLOWO2_01_FULL_48_11 TaxID=1798543 RepID=A0A1G2B0I1_9BACT|nr:MAG: hypothetical protein UY34_C0017G0008 [Parcubacteria group bacterium GW2011_GWA2_48_9]OGY82475.1 MAG: hypothetical protein A2898_05580 [Candidatus Kerfeldbacteria bacterium RIFCSPLOWO2_01_FULL_48_11]HCM68006.1 hypothetical protein [Candidatus Kerfeldbacteria bacterium]
MTPFNEAQFASRIESHIKRCRPGDWEHCQRVVKWVKELGEGREDLPLLIVAGYVHDLGWRDTVKDKLTIDELLKLESKANANTTPNVKGLLTELKYSSEDIQTVLRLVHTAYEHESTQDDEAIIVDADNLSKLTIDHLREKYKQENWEKTVNHWESELSSRIQTEKGKQFWPKLLEELKTKIRSS